MAAPELSPPPQPQSQWRSASPFSGVEITSLDGNSTLRLHAAAEAADSPTLTLFASVSAALTRPLVTARLLHEPPLAPAPVAHAVVTDEQDHPVKHTFVFEPTVAPPPAATATKAAVGAGDAPAAERAAVEVTVHCETAQLLICATCYVSDSPLTLAFELPTAAGANARTPVFGLAHLMWQHWPLSDAALSPTPCYAFDNGPTGVATLLDPTFVSTTGLVLRAADDTPNLHVSVNAPPSSDHSAARLLWTVGLANRSRPLLPEPVAAVRAAIPTRIALQSRPTSDLASVQHPWSVVAAHGRMAFHPPLVVPSIRCELAARTTALQATKLSLSTLRAKLARPIPVSPQKVKIMRHPIWSTWAEFHSDIDQAKVLALADSIVSRNLPRSVMGIDDRWSASYGELRFDPQRFPDPRDMVRRLHANGFYVTLWVLPFANVDSPYVQDAATQQFYVKMPSGVLGTFKWWGGPDDDAVALDVLNPHACDWFVSKLEALRSEFGIDGFKFDAGEPCFVPQGSVLHQSCTNPNDYTRAWILNVASRFPVSEARSAVRGCQVAAPLFRIFDRDSNWTLKNGLASVLTSILTSGILGFPFSIPDYVGGNNYDEHIEEQCEDGAELLVRWAQLSCVMPSLQLSIPPWRFASRYEKMVEKVFSWRELFFWPHIKECIADASEKYWPIVRPMWWAEPEIEEPFTATIADQFMVGDNLIVAPVLELKQRKRQVFLPPGEWRKLSLSDGTQSDEKYIGPHFVPDISAELDDMPVFIRANTP